MTHVAYNHVFVFFQNMLVSERILSSGYPPSLVQLISFLPVWVQKGHGETLVGPHNSMVASHRVLLDDMLPTPHLQKYRVEPRSHLNQLAPENFNKASLPSTISLYNSGSVNFEMWGG